MSWEYTRRKITCEKCGHSGIQIDGSDDWGRTTVEWEGFARSQTPEYLVARKREGPERPRCVCGSTAVHLGEVIPE